ncbi:hypothetical protein [Metabacillus halosaccharovorans]|uniref:Nucleotidase n=1 Tax=Metabacillus halosaccharovorans TaxID=930124 RepID=A0ABT3DCT8_9BACI|nr:hypothetical protein [Metabacillus halosaccharovorans]MCV9884870.1 hypothetical protein [Metabacillus halosaccharovorans]
MLRLGIDIDGTVTDPQTFLPYLNQSFKKSLTYQDLTQYDLTKVYNITDADFWSWMDEFEPIIYKEAPLALHAKEVLDEWKDMYQLMFISARRKHLMEITNQWFKDKDLFYHHIELIGSHDKLAAVKENNISIFFEDKHDNACMINEEHSIPVILFNTPYNQDPIPKGVIRVNNWREAKKWVQQWTEIKI